MNLKQKVSEILEGYTNAGLSTIGLATIEMQAVANERYTICKSCDDHFKLGLCDLCGCVMKIKTYSMKAKCDINKWEAYDIGIV